MTQAYDEAGNVHAVTVLRAPGVVVTDVRTKEKNGYEGVQVAMDEQKVQRVTKSELGHFAGKGYKTVREFRTPVGDIQKGASIKADIFQAGDVVIASGITKAKGFQGAVKLHGFKGGWDQHGQKHSHREVGSIGGGGRAGGRVVRGKKMPGRMGGKRVTVKNLSIFGVDAEKGFILINGAVPGRRGTIIELKSLDK